ncbi:hypothetical protein Tco_1501653 [Tanacetum coccineum]
MVNKSPTHYPCDFARTFRVILFSIYSDNGNPSRVNIKQLCDPSSETKLQGILLESFQEDAKYEHVGQDTRSQGGKDNKDKQGKDLKISESETKSKDNDKG